MFSLLPTVYIYKKGKKNQNVIILQLYCHSGQLYRGNGVYTDYNGYFFGEWACHKSCMPWGY